MKTTKKLISLALIAVMMFALVACINSDIIGTWVLEKDDITVTYTFENTGTGSAQAPGITMDFKFEINDDELIMETITFGITRTEVYTFEIDGDTLKLTKDGETIELTRE